MTKKNDKRLCWNCEGNVSHHLVQCPYCGVDVTQQPAGEGTPIFKGFASPFQSAPQQEIPQPPYGQTNRRGTTVTEEEWNSALNEKKVHPATEEREEEALDSKREMIGLLLLLPGVVFALFGLALILFSHKGVLTLQWDQSIAYFYFLGALPLLYLGWRALRN